MALLQMNGGRDGSDHLDCDRPGGRRSIRGQGHRVGGGNGCLHGSEDAGEEEAWRGPDAELVVAMRGKAPETWQAAALSRRSATSTRDGSRLAVGWFVGVLVCVPLLVPRPAVGATDPCPRHLNDGTTGTALSPPIALTPASSSAQRIVNFGTSRATKVVKRLVFTADKLLPDSLNPQQLNFDALISRAGDTLESTDFPDPTFSEPRISQDRQSITFDVCLSPGSIPPGKYVGAVTRTSRH